MSKPSASVAVALFLVACDGGSSTGVPGGAGGEVVSGGGGTTVDASASGGSTGGGGIAAGSGGGAAGSSGAGGKTGIGGGAAGGATGSGGVTGAGGATGSGGASTGQTPVQKWGQLKVVGKQLQDENGNPVQLRGVSSMWLNWESKAFPESKPAVQWARDNWNLSVIRASMGVEASGGYLTSTAGVSNKTKMQTKVDTIVQNAIDLGIYVLVDWHTEKAVNQQADSVAFFTAMATKWGSYPNVIWEDYNEPNGFTWTQIKPYHQAVVDAIRAIDPDNLIVLGTPSWSQGVDLAAADPVSGTNLLYTLHFYACSHGASLRTKGDTALSKNVALFVTEFGCTPADGGVISKGDPYVCESACTDWFNWMNTNKISGISWKLDQCTDTSCLLTSTAPVDGPWTDDVLTKTGTTQVSTGVMSGGGHGYFVVHNWINP